MNKTEIAIIGFLLMFLGSFIANHNEDGSYDYLTLVLYISCFIAIGIALQFN